MSYLDEITPLDEMENRAIRAEVRFQVVVETIQSIYREMKYNEGKAAKVLEVGYERLGYLLENIENEKTKA